MTLSFNGVFFTKIFLLADVQFPILGIDFLRHHHLMVDAIGGQLIDNRSMPRRGPTAAERHSFGLFGLHITNGRFRRLYPAIHAVAEATLKDMEQQGIVSRSTSCLVLSLHMV